MANGLWHSAIDLVDKFGWSWNQRKNEMQRDGSLKFEGRTVENDPSHWEYRLITPHAEIDFEKCCHKPLRVGKNNQIVMNYEEGNHDQYNHR